ncbi:hypothetical protein MMC07_001873 [Pseudocyphellaria aurata]|nr:hypothetical protein [Pseudocyphellaria aurata]
MSAYNSETLDDYLLGLAAKDILNSPFVDENVNLEEMSATNAEISDNASLIADEAEPYPQASPFDNLQEMSATNAEIPYNDSLTADEDVNLEEAFEHFPQASPFDNIQEISATAAGTPHENLNPWFLDEKVNLEKMFAPYLSPQVSPQGPMELAPSLSAGLPPPSPYAHAYPPFPAPFNQGMESQPIPVFHYTQAQGSPQLTPIGLDGQMSGYTHAQGSPQLTPTGSNGQMLAYTQAQGSPQLTPIGSNGQMLAYTQAQGSPQLTPIGLIGQMSGYTQAQGSPLQYQGLVPLYVAVHSVAGEGIRHSAVDTPEGPHSAVDTPRSKRGRRSKRPPTPKSVASSSRSEPRQRKRTMERRRRRMASSTQQQQRRQLRKAEVDPLSSGSSDELA